MSVRWLLMVVALFHPCACCLWRLCSRPGSIEVVASLGLPCSGLLLWTWVALWTLRKRRVGLECSARSVSTRSVWSRSTGICTVGDLRNWRMLFLRVLMAVLFWLWRPRLLLWIGLLRALDLLGGL